MPYQRVSQNTYPESTSPNNSLEGRLLQRSLDLLQGADIQFHRESRLDISIVKNLPIALIFLPAADIPTSVGEGRVDLGITGLDQVAEHDAGVEAINFWRDSSGGSSPMATEKFHTSVEQIMDLGFGKCRLQVQVPEKGPYQKPSDLIGKNIGTSFVSLTEDYFANLEEQAGLQNGYLPGKRTLKTKIVELSGSVEAACALGVADGIVDLVGEFLYLLQYKHISNRKYRIRRDYESSRSKTN